MPRFLVPTLPVFVAVTVLVLASSPLRAQQEHEHGAATAAGHSCACCGNSGGGAMNHAGGGGGCCGNMATAQAATPADDHSAHQAPAAPAAKAANGATAGCCGKGATAGAPAGAKTTPMAQAAGAGCCAGMNHGAAAKVAAKPMAQGAAGGCCAGMNHGAAKAGGTAMDHGAGGCCGGSMASADNSAMSDMQVFHFLLDNRADIRRTVTVLPNGIDTTTESDKPEIAAKLKTHVAAIYARLKDGKPIHQRDPLFVELFEHADQIDANITYTEKGLRVVETSADPAVATLLHKHAEVVNGFIKNGMSEMMKNHLE